MDKRPDLTPPADADALALTAALLRLGHAALSYIAVDSAPGISRIALGRDSNGCPLTFVSALAPHLGGVRATPACALMLGEPGAKGDPLTHPRLMIRAQAAFATDEERAMLRAVWLAQHPKAKLYIDFTDFGFIWLHPTSAVLNAGFGKAFTITPDQLRAAQ